MKKAICVVVGVGCGFVCLCYVLLNAGEGSSSTWVSFDKEAAAVRNGYRMTEEFDPSSYVRSVFVQRESDKEPLLLYTHHRRIEASLGHLGQLALINDYFATKACRVVVADVESGRNWRIDEEARRQYLQAAPKQWRPDLSIPKAIAFSPDDRMALIAMNSGYVASSPKQAEQFGEAFELWSYVVDCSNGSVLHTYQRSVTIDGKWWEL